MAFKVEQVDWQSASHRLIELREQVFVLEWQLPREAEFDKDDETALHIIVSDTDNKTIATARLKLTGEIGRIAIRMGYRNIDVYKQLFGALVTLAYSLNIDTLTMNCDLNTVTHHESLGFVCSGAAFMEAGIARQPMSCPLSAFKLPDAEHLH
ncbi:GNAT family N-acetyltransferase [Salinimonas chungwhensis]|uniref:GNAT family N-acetyltransferase n=1 Tax=Salinimonas chungwhensis TaxID=265425 RepID=UPI00037738B6|nr:GNAT family N-acetyltransferase [Salinimonas chungwhensis]